jgi:hypothetical protein
MAPSLPTILCGANGCGAWVSGSDTGGTEAVWRREASRRAEYEWHGRVRLLARWKRSEAYVVRHERLRAMEQAASRLCACPAHQPLGVDVSFRNPCGSTQHAARRRSAAGSRLERARQDADARNQPPSPVWMPRAALVCGRWSSRPEVSVAAQSPSHHARQANVAVYALIMISCEHTLGDNARLRMYRHAWLSTAAARAPSPASMSVLTSCECRRAPGPGPPQLITLPSPLGTSALMSSRDSTTSSCVQMP